MDMNVGFVLRIMICLFYFILEPDLRARFRVQMINNVGLEEVGIDGGGVFREFLSELIKTAFDPNRGFFMLVELKFIRYKALTF